MGFAIEYTQLACSS